MRPVNDAGALDAGAIDSGIQDSGPAPDAGATDAGMIYTGALVGGAGAWPGLIAGVSYKSGTQLGVTDALCP